MVEERIGGKTEIRDEREKENNGKEDREERRK